MSVPTPDAERISGIYWISGIIGIILAGFGVAAVLIGGILEIAITEVFFYLGAVIALLLGIWRVRVRFNQGVDHLGLPVPELPFSNPTPGDDLDSMIHAYVTQGEQALEIPKQVGERLREAAIAAIAHREDITRDEAIDRLADGSWTEDQLAASYFAEDIPIPAQDFDVRLKAKLGIGKTLYEQQIEAVVNEIIGIAEMIEPREADESIESEDDEGGFLDRLGVGGGSGNRVITRGETSVQDYEDNPGEQLTDNLSQRPPRGTRRWLGMDACALLTFGVGVAALQPSLILLGALFGGYSGFARIGWTPTPGGVSVKREFSTRTPTPGEHVTVSVTVTNEGGSLLPDLRMIDLVPPNMRVVDGSPRVYTALRPGAEVVFQYTLMAERGTHEWPLLAVTSGFSGSVEQEFIMTVDSTLDCLPRLRTVADVPVRAQTSILEGQVKTAEAGPGLEFHSVRDYEPGDSMRRIEWKHFARTGELATIDFRVERAATVVLLFDAREDAYVSDHPANRHALDRSVDAATEVYAALSDSGDLVGLAAFDTIPCWLAPGAGSGHNERVRLLLAHHPAIQSMPPSMSDREGQYIDPMLHVRRQMSSGTQVLMFSPITAPYPAEVARRLNSAGHLVTVISPDPTAERTPGERLARVERAIRINMLRERGIRVVDWGTDKSLPLAFEEAKRGWGA